MMRLVTAAEMRTLEEAAVTELGVTVQVLMERAGLLLAGRIGSLRPPGPVGILAGPGNNGGDALVAGEWLRRQGVDVRFGLLGEPRGLCAQVVERLRRQGARLLRLPDEREELLGVRLFLDGFLGTGARGAPRPPMAEMMAYIRRMGVPIWAVDLPTGVDGDTGAAAGEVFSCSRTFAMGLAAPGLYLLPGKAHAGTVEVLDIGIPRSAEGRLAPGFSLLTRRDIREGLPSRSPEGHKGTFGRVLVAGGSRWMPGALRLAALGALGGGAGLVTVAGTREVLAGLPAMLPQAVLRELPEAADGGMAREAVTVLAEAEAGQHAVCLGMGMGLGEEAATVVEAAWHRQGPPLVLDADALTHLARLGPSPSPRSTVLTPHAGEMGRLLGVATAEVTADRMGAVRECQHRYGGIVLLKGNPTLVWGPGGGLLNPTGGPILGVGGSGDTLSGLIGALLAAGTSPWQAAGFGAYLHGLSGSLWSAAHGGADRGLPPQELASWLPRAMAALGEEEL